MRFSELVEEVLCRPVEEQIELQEILQHNLVALRREEIYQNHHTTLQELESEKLKFSSEVDELMSQLSGDVDGALRF